MSQKAVTLQKAVTSQKMVTSQKAVQRTNQQEQCDETKYI